MSNNIIDFHSLFFGCSSLKKLPDISKWNINNHINNIDYNESSNEFSLPEEDIDPSIDFYKNILNLGPYENTTSIKNDK